MEDKYLAFVKAVGNNNLMNFIRTNPVYFVFILLYASVAVACVVFREYQLATICLLSVILFYTDGRHWLRRKEILRQIADKEVEVASHRREQ